MLQKKEVPYIGYARALGVGGSYSGAGDVVDLDGEGEVLSPLEKNSAQWEAIHRAVDQRSACSSCFGHLSAVLRRWDGPLPWKEKEICIGQDFKGEILAKGQWGIGSCTEGSRCLKGCPPSEDDIRSFLEGLNG
ncbi:MAG: hypothetical protein PQJ59_08215 [Spirochaetales bacterium]|nr:hypothetical protein [Spirochaetales bacterium]